MPTLARVIVSDIPDVPDLSAEWYRRIVDAAAELPGPLQAAAVFATEAVLAVYLAAFALLWWRARTRPAPVTARALAAPVVTVLAYALSDTAKGWKAVDRARPTCRRWSRAGSSTACRPRAARAAPTRRSRSSPIGSARCSA